MIPAYARVLAIAAMRFKVRMRGDSLCSRRWYTLIWTLRIADVIAAIVAPIEIKTTISVCGVSAKPFDMVASEIGTLVRAISRYRLPMVHAQARIGKRSKTKRTQDPYRVLLPFVLALVVGRSGAFLLVLTRCFLGFDIMMTSNNEVRVWVRQI